MRSLIKPPEGYGLAYIDFALQEIGVAAALSGDELMAKGYEEGDPYISFAKAAKLVPQDARPMQVGCLGCELWNGA
jgi:hypothetical protein